MAFKIEKGIPIPASGSDGQPYKYPFRDMDVGDSIGFENHHQMKKAYLSYNATHRNVEMMRGRRFIFRSRGNGTYRCWRVE